MPSKATTRLPEREQQTSRRKRKEAAKETERFFRGEVDFVTLIRTPGGEEVVDSYQRETSE